MDYMSYEQDLGAGVFETLREKVYPKAPEAPKSVRTGISLMAQLTPGVSNAPPIAPAVKQKRILLATGVVVLGLGGLYLLFKRKKR